MKSNPDICQNVMIFEKDVEHFLSTAIKKVRGRILAKFVTNAGKIPFLALHSAVNSVPRPHLVTLLMNARNLNFLMPLKIIMTFLSYRF